MLTKSRALIQTSWRISIRHVSKNIKIKRCSAASSFESSSKKDRPDDRCFSSSSSSSPAPSSTTGDLIPSPQSSLMTPIDFATSSSIEGEESQILKVDLEPNQVLRAESGAMIFMTQGIEMSTSLGGSGGTSSNISDGFKRMLTGQNMFISDYTYNGAEGTFGTVALGTDFPSKIIRLSLSDYGNKIVCQKGAYLASDLNVDIQMEFAKKFTAGFFGGEGFILQGLIGDGDVFVKAGGTLVKKELRGGETLRISSGSLVAFTQDVEFDVQTMPGFKNVLFGGEGLFLTTLTGPGTVWLQGMPPDRMISEIARRVPSGGIGLGIPVGLGGGGSPEGGDTPAGDAAEGVVNDNDGDGEDLVASTDAAVEADRNATVASSGLSDTADPESSSALFGDAAPASAGSTDHSESSSVIHDESNIMPPEPGLDDSTSFSTEDTDFGEDITNQQFDDFQQDETSFSTDIGGEGGDSDGGSSIIDTIWNIFFEDD